MFKSAKKYLLHQEVGLFIRARWTDSCSSLFNHPHNPSKLRTRFVNCPIFWNIKSSGHGGNFL